MFRLSQPFNSSTAQSRVDANLRLLSLLHLFELNADDGEPGDIESVAERLVILMAHAAVGVVDAHRPDFFARLLECDNDIRAVHSLGQFLEQFPKLVPKRRNSIRPPFGRFLHRTPSRFGCHVQECSNSEARAISLYPGTLNAFEPTPASPEVLTEPTGSSTHSD